MSSLIEVLKDKEGRKPLVRLFIGIIVFSLLTFAMGFFAAFVYGQLYPAQTRQINEQLFGTPKELPMPVQPKT